MATTSTEPTPQVSQDDSATIPSLVVTNFFTNATPELAKLADLSAFAQVQFSYYASLGVGKPLLGPYEAIGRAFAEQPSFQAKYGSLTDTFVTTAYQDVFGRPPGAEQVSHFQQQIDYFVSIYTKAGISPASALDYAQGAAIGQMLGHAVTEGGSLFDYAGAAKAYIAQIGTAGFVPGRPLSNFDGGGATPPTTGGGGSGGGGGGGGVTPPAPVPDAIENVKTIQQAINDAAVGATIRVGAGTFDENVAVTKNVTVIFDAGTVLKGGFAVSNGVSSFSVSGGKIDGGLDGAVAGITTASENNAGIYAQGPSTINVSGVQFTGTASTRGLVGADGQDAKFVVNGGSFSGLLTGIYLNKGNDAQVTGAIFTNNTAAIGGVSTGTKVGISGSTFASNTEDLGIEGKQKIEALTLQSNIGLTKINVYDAGAHRFKAGDLSVQNVYLVGTGASIAGTIAAANGEKILLGGGVHNEALNVMSKVNIEGVGGAVLTGSGQSTITLYDAADGSTFSNLKIVATLGGNALANAVQPVKNITLAGNTFDAGYNTAGSLVYLNPGSDGWLIKNNTFAGQYLTVSPLLGIEGAGHLVTGNSFGPVGGSYPKIESFTPSVIFSGNAGLQTIFKAGAFEYEQRVVSVSSLTGAGRTEVANGAVTLADSGSLGRATSLFLDSDNGSGRLRFNELFDQPNEPAAFKLSDLKLLQFDFKMQQEPSVNPSHAPVLRLRIDVDGDLNTNDTAELVAEWVYQGGASPSKTEWNTFDVASAKLWQRSNATNFDQISNLKSLSEWTAGNNKPTAGAVSGVDIGPNAKVLGYSLAFGSGNGSAEYFVDNLAVGFAGSAATTGSVYLYSFG